MKKPIFFKSRERDCVGCLICGTKDEFIQCAGDKFQILDSSMAEGAGEKHLPVIEKKGNAICVSVGSVAHPMTEEHSINWVYLETKQGGQLKILCPDEKPEVTFALTEGDEAIAVYAYCNLHGFWKTDITG